MSDLNQCTFTGRLGADPEHRSTKSGDPIANMRLAVGKQWKDRDGNKQESTEWISVVCFNKGLCKLMEYAQKGTRLWVSGRFQTRTWEDQSGQKRYSSEIVVQPFDGNIQIIDGGRNSGDDQGRQQSNDSGAGYADAKAGQRPARQSSMADDMDDHIPF